MRARLSDFMRSRLRLSFACALAFTVMLAACGDDAPQPESAQPKPPVAQTPPPPPQPEPAKAQRAYPVTDETRATYQYYCTQCHGLKGKGDGINARHVVVPPRDHTKAEYLESRSDEQLFHAIKHGGLSTGRAPCMPAWGNTFDDAIIHSLVSYIRELCECEGLF